ncbi:MAG: hypothetical protein A2V57_04725 [Candidatus Aminicenantes bacterium RBG_19FT_COMBO_65_30]|nr:MAG: hypothetical protein A2V57_04725 [Candidatus Aminicenantes bacterium RBG_19FT_COMBO_65_30]
MGALAVLAGLVLPLDAQEPAKRQTVSCIVTAPPKIDGLVDDACWQGVEPVSGFFQYDPINGAKASEETLVWAAFDQDYLYFAFLMKDSQPDKIWAELTPRNEFENNDSITLILDAYNDKRTSITFSLNPKGIQKNSVETIWKSEAAMRPDGWSAEMAIPFKSLRFSARKLEVWGVNFERYIHRLNETDYWTDVDRDLPKLQQSGELCGLTGLRPGYNLEFFPYAGVRTSKWEDETDTKAAVGLDAKWGIKPNLYLDVTASPDFSEVESDPFIYQLSPYENYLEENRPFFTEGSRYFSLSTGDEYHGGGISLFYSRRVRNPKIAAKISGKTGGFGFGILGALNKEDAGDSFFGVFRVQKDIFKNSQVGVYYAGIHDGADRNQNVAVDFNFNFKDFYYIQGMSALTFNEGVAGARNGIHQIQFQREPDAGLQIMSGFQRIEDNVDIRTGYIDQVDVQSFDLMAGYAWRYNKGLFKRFSFDVGGELRQDSHGNATGEGMEVMFFSDLFNRIEVHGGFDLGRSKYQVLDVADELVWTPDYIKTYGGNLDFSWERGGFLKEISVEGGWDKRGVYNEEFTAVVPGTQTSVEGQLVLRPRSNLEWSIEGDWIRQTIDGTGAEAFNGLAYETALHYQLTRSLFLNTRFLGETRENQYSLDFLVGYYFGAGNIVQLSFKKSERNELLGRVGGYSITLKVSYLLRI